MAAQVTSRPGAPQLPPLRALYPSRVANHMVVTHLDFPSGHMQSPGQIPLSKGANFSRPLPLPPTEAPAGPPRISTPPRYPISQQQQGPSKPSQRPPTTIVNGAKRGVHRGMSPAPHRPSSNFFLHTNITPLALQEPSVLHALVWQLEWADCYNLLTSCKRLYSFFDITALRDVILARYLPEYAVCLQTRDMQFFQDVPVTVLDLDLLLISQRLPLHRYPIHALKVESSMLPTLEDEQTTDKLAALTQAHSRFVLLFQSLVHSSSAPMPQETEEGSSRPRFSPIQTLRELTFPAPLAYTEAPPPPPPKDGSNSNSSSGRSSNSSSFTRMTAAAPNGDSKHHIRHTSAPSNFTVGKNRVLSTPVLSWPSKPPSPRPSADAASSMISNNNNRISTLKKGRRISIFGGKRSSLVVTPPPPPEEPRALRVYASTWRKTSYWGSSYGDNIITDDFAFSSPGGSLKRPRRLASRQMLRSKDSSETSLNSSSHNSRSSPLSQTRSRNSMSVVNHPEAGATSPHDLILATSRVRAPILRVFVPCSKLDEGDVVKCEQQLVESGLWSHLSTGDVVCNLGYVPPVEDGNSSSEGEDLSGSAQGEYIMMRPGASGLSSANGGNNTGGSSAQQKWLLFNGHVLVPYTPPDLLPLDQPLNLPTPFYYAHIMPSFTNLSYVITQLPVCDDVPQLTLVHSSKKVRSPHSPSGFALVKKYSWIARVVRMRTAGDGEMGEGWFGEWVLEGEGTPEGKVVLLNALRGYELGHREWELVREKSGGGKLWLRLLTS